MSDLELLVWTKVVVVAVLGWGMLFYRRLWQGERGCPRLPLLPGLPQIPHEAAFHRVMLMLLAAIGLAPNPPGALAVIFAALVVAFVLTDETRLRPLLYQFTPMLLAVVLCPLEKALGICRLIAVCVYFWAGLLKLNSRFLDHVYPWFTGPLAERLPLWARRPLQLMGPTVAPLEVSLAVGLLFPSTRGLCLLAIAGMHAFILFAISRPGHRGMGELLPWNGGMAAVNFALFWSCDAEAASILIGDKSMAHLLVLGLFGLMPTMGLFNKGSLMLCHSHMTGRQPFSGLVLAASLHARLPVKLRAVCRPLSVEGLYSLDPTEWFLNEVKVMAPPSLRAGHAIALDFARYEPDDYELQLVDLRCEGVYRITTHQETYYWRDLRP